MKLIIQIPCYNEAGSLPQTLRELPRHLAGIDQVEILVVDDGSQDGSPAVAKESGADHIVCLSGHSGLAAAFTAGLDACLRLGADIILNTDADNQYDPQDIPALLQPVLDGRSEMAIGDRRVATLAEFSSIKRLLQSVGSGVVSRAAGFPIPDAASGFRVLNREAALRTVVLSNYSYTLETLIQAGARQAAVVYVPVHSRPTGRPSRLIHSQVDYLIHSSAIVVRAYTHYRPLRVFLAAGGLFLLAGLVLATRYLVFFFQGQGVGHVQSVILAAVLFIVGFQTWLIGLIADSIGFNRKLLEETLYRVKKMETDAYRGSQNDRDI
ncbi:MAG: glycosyltransferase family 2 protein [Anaerolineaceae bacterium]|nr:glycosyltransferase family 2 protein [Anaerolineaceae bacterium]